MMQQDWDRCFGLGATDPGSCQCEDCHPKREPVPKKKSKKKAKKKKKKVKRV